MAFIDDDDIKTPEPTATQVSQPQVPAVVVQQAPRSKLVPVLLISFNLLLVVVLGVLFKDSIFGGESADTAASVDDIDPKLLVTPDGRKLDVVVFGNKVFEITRISYNSINPRSSSVTLTVPGDPPRQAVKQYGETFASGAIRIVEIGPDGILLDASGVRKRFNINGEQPSDWAERTNGKVSIPARNFDLVPSAPDGQRVVPKDPLVEVESENPEENSAEEPAYESLPDVREVPMDRPDYLKLIRELPKIFEEEFVLQGFFIEGEALPYGLEVKRLKSDSFFYTHGFKLGDVILNINDEEIRRYSELDIAVRSNSFHDELRIDILRNDEVVTYFIFPGVGNPRD
ncbi:MAG: PDZ domain-containing protein [Planctomycetota bacterium]